MNYLKRFFLIVVISSNMFTCANAQFTILDMIESFKQELIKISTEKLTKKYGKEFTSQFNRYLFVPYVDLNNDELNPENSFLKRNNKETLRTSIKNDPTIGNIKLSIDSKYTIYVYDDSLNIYRVVYNFFRTSPSKEMQIQIKYFLSLNADLLFHIWGLNDFFVLLDDKIYMIKYNKSLQSCDLISF